MLARNANLLDCTECRKQVWILKKVGVGTDDPTIQSLAIVPWREPSSLGEKDTFFSSDKNVPLPGFLGLFSHVT